MEHSRPGIGLSPASQQLHGEHIKEFELLVKYSSVCDLWVVLFVGERVACLVCLGDGCGVDVCGGGGGGVEGGVWWVGWCERN